MKCRLDYRYSPQNIFNAKNFNPHKKPISLLNVPICTQGMQRTWWLEAGIIIVTHYHLPLGYIDGLVQHCRICIAIALKIMQFWAKSSISAYYYVPMACPCMGSSDGDCILPIADDDVIKWRKFPRHWPFVRGIHRWPVNSQHKGQWRGALVLFSLISAWINRCVNNCEAGDLRRHHAHYKVTVMSLTIPDAIQSQRDIGRPEWYQSYFTNSIWLFWSIVPEEVGLLMIQRSNWHAHHWCQYLSFQTILHWKQLQKDSDYPCRNLYGSLPTL